jgi:hypothetical protein
MVVPNQPSTTSAQASAVQAHLQAQQQAAAVEAQRRTSFFQMQHAAPPMMNGFFPSIQAAAVAQMNATAMVATAKLANSKDKKETNSALVVRSSVPKFNVAGGLYTVSQWARKCVEDNLEWIVKLARRHDPEEKAVMLAYGDGCQTLVLLDGAMNRMPPNLNVVQKIGIGVSAAPIDDKSDDKKMAAAGVLQPTDSIWDHLRYEQTDMSKDKVEKVMFIHTCMTNYGDGIEGRRRVLQVKTGAPQQPYLAIAYVPNVVFEQQVLTKWKGPSPIGPNLAAMNMAAMTGGFLVPNMGGGVGGSNMMAHSASDSGTPAHPKENETVITFNPKELILLEKAWNGTLTSRDLKSKADKWTDADKQNCQATIQNATSEFKGTATKKRKKNDGAATKSDSNTKKATSVTTKVAATTTTKGTPKKKDEMKDGAKVASKDGPTKNAVAPTLPKKAESSSSSKKKTTVDNKAETITKTPAKKTPTAASSTKAAVTAPSATTGAPPNKEPKSTSKKSVKAEKKEPLKGKEQQGSVDSDDEPISKLKDTPSAKKKPSSSTVTPKSSHKSSSSGSSKKEVKKSESNDAKKGGSESSSTKKRGRSSNMKEEKNPAKKTRSNSKSKK